MTAAAANLGEADTTAVLVGKPAAVKSGRGARTAASATSHRLQTP